MRVLVLVIMLAAIVQSSPMPPQTVESAQKTVESAPQTIESAPLTLSALIVIGGALMSVFVLAFGVLVRDRQVMRMISEVETRTCDKAIQGDEKLHERVNGVNLKLETSYVKTSEIDAHVNTIRVIVGEMRDSFTGSQKMLGEALNSAIKHMEETNKRIDRVYERLSEDSKRK